MTDNHKQTMDTIAQTLLEIGGRVLEVSRQHVITNKWEKVNKDEKYTNIDIDAIVAQNNKLITNCFENNTAEITEHITYFGSTITKYKIRILTIHPNKDSLFLVIEYLSENEYDKIPEQYWKEAIDAAGDGMWDMIMPENNIYFSDKWHTTFGYKNNKTKTIDEWENIIHPDDIEDVKNRTNDYFEGKTKYYNSEFRIICEDGTIRWVMSRGLIISRDSDGKPLRFTGMHTDIHDRKVAEERYYETAQLLSKLINNLQDGVLLIDEKDKVIYANQMFCDIYGLTYHPDSLIGMDYEEKLQSKKLFYKEADKFYTRTIEILKKKEIVLNEAWEMTNGKILSRDFIPLNLGKNNRGGIWRSRDITSQKNTEKQLAEVREFYERILNHIGADIVVFDAKQRYLFINPTAIKDKDLREWMIGKTDEDYCRVRNKSIELVKRRKTVFETARDSRKPLTWEETLINREGATEHHLRVMYPVFDANGTHVYGIGYGLNITERVKAKQELKTSMEMFASAFNDSGTGMAIVSPEGKWIDVNKEVCEITGYSKDELKKLTFQDITHPDDLEADMLLVNEMLKKERASYSIEKRYISKQKKIIHVLLTVSLVWNNDNTPKFFISQLVDITAQKELEREINKKTSALTATKEALLNKINQLEDLSHIIAHNLRGPAGNIKMLSETMLSKYNPDNDGQQALKIAFTEEEAMILIHDASLSLLDSLATLMQITEIKLNKEIPHDLCDINTIINEICNQLQSTIFEKQALILRELQVTEISYPKAYFENILYNLISNSLKYSKASERPKILITTLLKDDRVKLTVKDNGLGIDMEKYADRVFRLNEVFHSGFDSKGVGLYITKTQIESFGGTIEVKSKTNEGCEFTVTL